MPSLLASFEPAWCDAGLGSPAVHVELDGVEPDAFARALGVRVTHQDDLLRLEPTVDLQTFAALLRTHGWAVDQERTVLTATCE